MKKFLAIFSVLSLVTPALAFAAYNDVTLTTSTVLTVNGHTITVTGSSATIESIIVEDSDFVIGMQANSTISVTEANGYYLSVASPAPIAIQNQCDSSASIVTITSSVPDTVTITPYGSTCPLTSSGGGGGGGGGGNGAPVGSTGGGGGGASVPVTAPTTPATTPASTMAASLQAQIASLMARISALKGSSIGSSVSFTSDLQLGSVSASVKALQVYLNTHGYTVAASGPGSSGYETSKFGAGTRAALVKLQKAAGISPAFGNFGPKTRAYINSHQ